MSLEIIPDTNRVPVNAKIPAELYSLTKGTTDYACFTKRLVLMTFLQSREQNFGNSNLLKQKFGMLHRLIAA